MLWVQHVEVLYTKASRGGRAAAIRNQLPRAFLMQTGVSGAFSFEHYKLLEWADFVPTLEDQSQERSIPRRRGDLVINPLGEEVTLGLRARYSVGKPARRQKLNAITLSKGQTARLIINGRYSSGSGQIYTEATYNVAFDHSLEPDVFLKARNSAVFDMRADLF